MRPIWEKGGAKGRPTRAFATPLLTGGCQVVANKSVSQYAYVHERKGKNI
jgi:hypothetical protein